MTTKFLNLDEIAAPEKSVKIEGVDYVVLDMTVENFIETTRNEKALEKASSDVQFEAAVKMIQRYIPTIPLDVLLKLNFQKVNVLMKFVTGELTDEVQKSTEAAAAETSETAEKQE